MAKKKYDVSPLYYYNALGKGEKSKFLQYLSQEYEWAAKTAGEKLRGHVKMKKGEIILIEKAIEEEEKWRT